MNNERCVLLCVRHAKLFPISQTMDRLLALLAISALASAKCPLGSVQGLTDDACYSFSVDSTSWSRAEEQCVKQGGHLASVSNGFTNSFLSSTAVGRPSQTTGSMVMDVWNS